MEAPERGSLRTAEFGASIDLIGENPGSVAVGECDDPGHGSVIQDGSGRVVRVGDENETRAVPQALLQLVQVGLPAVLFHQVERVDVCPEALEQPWNLHVVGQHDRDRRARLHELPESREVGFGPAGGHQHRRFARAGIEIRDQVSEVVTAVGLPISETYVESIRTEVRQGQQLGDRQWVHPTLGKIEANAVLVRGLPPFHDERMVLHFRSSARE